MFTYFLAFNSTFPISRLLLQIIFKAIIHLGNSERILLHGSIFKIKFSLDFYE